MKRSLSVTHLQQLLPVRDQLILAQHGAPSDPISDSVTSQCWNRDANCAPSLRMITRRELTWSLWRNATVTEEHRQ